MLSYLCQGDIALSLHLTIAEKSNGNNNQAKQNTLVGFSNWPIWLSITKSILVEIDI